MMQLAIEHAQRGKAPESAALMTHEEKRDMIRRCIETNARGKNFWMTFSEISDRTGLTAKDVIKTMYNSGDCFLESTWRKRNGEMLVTVRQLYEDRTSFFEKALATFTGQWD